MCIRTTLSYNIDCSVIKINIINIKTCTFRYSYSCVKKQCDKSCIPELCLLTLLYLKLIAFNIRIGHNI